MNTRISSLFNKLPDELQVPIGMAITMCGIGLLFVLICAGVAILKLSGVV